MRLLRLLRLFHREQGFWQADSGFKGSHHMPGLIVASLLRLWRPGIHIHMLVSARAWRDKQIAMPGALRSRSFWLRAVAGLSFLGPLVPITTKEVSWTAVCTYCGFGQNKIVVLSGPESND